MTGKPFTSKVAGLSLAAIAMTASPALAEVSIERHLDCAVEFAAAHTMLTTERAAGRDISFDDVEEMRQMMIVSATNAGRRIRSMPEAQHQVYLDQFRSLTSARMNGLVVQASADGVEAALTTAVARAEACLSDLGQLALEEVPIEG